MATKERGFTLIEVMIAAVIVVLLLAIAVPSYQENVRRSRRAEAQTAMFGLAQALERYYTNNNTYTGAAVGGANSLFPPNVPPSGATNYVLSITLAADAATPGLAGSTYTITATRQGATANDPCGDLTLTAAGTRGLVNATSGKTVANCWN